MYTNKPLVRTLTNKDKNRIIKVFQDSNQDDFILEAYEINSNKLLYSDTMKDTTFSTYVSELVSQYGFVTESVYNPMLLVESE